MGVGYKYVLLTEMEQSLNVRVFEFYSSNGFAHQNQINMYFLLSILFINHEQQ